MIKKFVIKNHEYFIKYDTSNIKNINDSNLCLNWWPITKDVYVETNENWPHPLCAVCANWLPDIEDIGKILLTTKHSKCINEWTNTS